MNSETNEPIFMSFGKWILCIRDIYACLYLYIIITQNLCPHGVGELQRNQHCCCGSFRYWVPTYAFNLVILTFSSHPTRTELVPIKAIVGVPLYYVTHGQRFASVNPAILIPHMSLLTFSRN